MMKSVRRRVSSFLGAALRKGMQPGGFTKLFLCLCVFVVLGAGAAAPAVDWFKFEKDKKAPRDDGYGPDKGIGPPRPKWILGQVPPSPKTAAPNRAAASNRAAAPIGAAAPAAAPIGGSVGGFFGPAFPWPIIPLHVALLPDGRVLSYGTDQMGNQGAQMIYDVWDPTVGNGSNAHTVMPNNTTTDIFCSAVSLLASGKALIVGGDLTVNGVRNYSQNKVEIFNPSQNTLTASGQMTYPRWYPSITTLPNGDKLVLGGQLTPTPQQVGEPTPEVYSAIYGWRTVPGISIDQTQWYYPRGFVGFDGAVYVLQENGIIFRLNTDYAGTMTDTGSRLDADDNTLPSVMSLDANGNPFSVLMARYGGEAQVVDISKNPPVVTRVGNLNYTRSTGQLTLLPDGEVFANGGSTNFNDLTTAVYQSELYNRLTGTWTLGATAANPRLYHNSSLLLPDGSVLTAGGGAPGPVNELNAEIYYPPYLYLKDGSGNPAPRPTIVSAPSTALTLGQNFLVTVGANDQIRMINLIRVGADTHDFNPEQRLIPVPFTQSGTQITATLSASAELAPPGYYMLFVLNTAGVPAVAKIISIGPSLPDLIPTSLSYDSGTGVFTSVVKNQGTTATPGGVVVGVAYSVDGAYCTWGSVPGPLAAGASVTIGSDGGPCAIASGTHTITAFADDVDRIVELDKTNNQLSQTITVSGSGQLPDLIPTSLSYNSATGVFTSVVKNQGVGPTPASVVIGVAYSVDGANCTWGSVPGPLAAGASVTIGSDGGPCAIASGTHTITVFADDVDRIAESNKNNNMLSETITVSGSGQLPDLIPTSLSYNSATGVFTSVVKNQGTAATPTGVAIGVAYSLTGQTAPGDTSTDLWLRAHR